TKTVQSEVVRVAVNGPPRLGLDDREGPAVDTAVPLAVGGAADRSVEADVRGDDAAVLERALAPGADVREDPFAVLRLACRHEGSERQCGGGEVLGVIADDPAVVLEMLEHLAVAALAVPGPEPSFHVDRIAGPLHRLGLPKQRAAAAVEQAADDPVIGVVVGG